jgi:hypothetical protein
MAMVIERSLRATLADNPQTTMIIRQGLKEA